MIFAKPPASTFTFQASPTSNASDAAKRDQTTGLQQTLSTLTLEEAGEPGSASQSEATTSSPYNIHDEPAPDEPFYGQAFQSTLKSGMKIATDTADGVATLLASMNNNQQLRSLHENAETLRAFQGSGTRTIAVLGDSGQGEYAVRPE
jgi:hypothetical protein